METQQCKIWAMAGIFRDEENTGAHGPTTEPAQLFGYKFFRNSQYQEKTCAPDMFEEFLVVNYICRQSSPELAFIHRKNRRKGGGKQINPHS